MIRRVAPPSAGLRALTFDCYGTLVDWERGIGDALAELPSLRDADHPRLVRDRERFEHELLEGPYRPYGEILAESLERAAAAQALALEPHEGTRFAASMARWEPFADAPPALARLEERFVLAIVSNVETRTLRAAVRRLGVGFSMLVTAEQVRAYKPARQPFDEALGRLRLPRERVLHVAGSLYHDVAPALALGWRVAWIDRRGGRAPEEVQPELRCPDLRALADALLE